MESNTQLHKALERVKALEAAIRKHRDRKGDDRCWLDDAELYSVLNDGKKADTTTLPPLAVFLPNCARFWACRQSGKPYEAQDPIADLEERVERLELHQGEPKRIGCSD